MAADPLVRFLNKVVPFDNCWHWTGAKNPLGYGRFWMNGRLWYAHRASVVLHGREIPDGYEVDHLCFNPSCVRPSHLDVVTPMVNTHRSHGNASKTHCPSGHEHTPSNTYINPTRHARLCRQCHREYAASRRSS